MYWPIGAPKAYAASKHAPPRTKIIQSHDGAKETSESSDASIGDENSSDPNTTSQGEISRTDSAHSPASQDASSRHGSETPSQNGDEPNEEHVILSAAVSRGGSLFATITRSALMVWSTKPTVALASVVRSPQSLKAYGPNTALLLRPDALIVVVQTTLGYLITYSLATDPNARVYQIDLPESAHHARRSSTQGYSSFRRQSIANVEAGLGEGDGIKEVNIRFRMVLRIDAGLCKALALDDELIVATQRQPAAMQCIRWISDSSPKPQTSTELLRSMPWIMDSTCTVVEMIHDRPMNLSVWITSDGRSYAVQRRSAANVDMDNPASLFQGYCFREIESQDSTAIKSAVNARLSLIAVGCSDGSIEVYTVKDYTGNIPFSHTLQLSGTSTAPGLLTCLSYSPDGHCLFAGYEKGWAIWSVYGKALANSFSSDRSSAETIGEQWLLGVRDGFWMGGGCELMLIGNRDDRLWNLEIARSAVTTNFSPSNVSRGLLITSNSVKIYKGNEITDLTALPSDTSTLWQTVQIPTSYLTHQWPIKSAVISDDGKYIAVAGRKGLAHYSASSARWRMFEDPTAEYEFTVRGGLCWYLQFLVVCVEAAEGNRYQLRIYDRSKSLESSQIQHIEYLPAPAIYMTVSGTDSLLVYLQDNTLLHYIIVPKGNTVRLVQVGQIGFHGIIRAPQRVRAISWILPDDQFEHGDPSQDVATASVMFLVDGKLVLLQPSANKQGELKYDMRVIAQNVEYYNLLRDAPAVLPSPKTSAGSSDMANGLQQETGFGHSLRDSLWYFDGTSFHVWSDIQDVLAAAPAELGRDLPPTVQIPMDFYPISPLVGKGVLSGLEVDLTQRRDINFSFARLTPRTALFLPQLLRFHLAEYNESAALHLSHPYQTLPYFSHALEVLLHDILDAEVDKPPSPPETALLPSATAFLSSFPEYLDIIVNCTRKTELRSWRTLFSYLPPVLELFEQSLSQNKLKTAAGYLLVLHTLQEDQEQQEAVHVHEFGRLLHMAVKEQEWELCKELARFLVGIDSSGQTLRSALYEAGLDDNMANGTSEDDQALSDSSAGVNRNGIDGGVVDYFSLHRSGG